VREAPIHPGGVMHAAERRCDSSPVDANVTFSAFPQRWDKPASDSGRGITHPGASTTLSDPRVGRSGARAPGRSPSTPPPRHSHRADALGG
jgi:hypothetical protein